MFYSVITDILDIKKEDLVYSNDKIAFPIKYAALFVPSQQEKLSKDTVAALAKTGVGVGKRYDPKKKIELISTLQHGRSAVLPILIKFSDRYNNKYGWVNFKGIGNWRNGGGFAKNEKKMAPYCDELGHLGYIFAKRDQVLSDKLIAIGLRTSIVLFIIRLREIPEEDGTLHPVEEFLKKYGLDVGSTPVIVARGMRSHIRIDDFINAGGDKGTLLESAILDVRNRDKDKSVRDKETFLVWFAETIAKQLAILYSVRAYHSYLTVHNITMAAEIVDLDSMISHVLMDIDKEVTPENMFEDVRCGWISLGQLILSVGLNKKQAHALLVKHYMFRYLEHVVELRFKSDQRMVTDVKKDLAIVYDLINNPGNRYKQLNEDRLYELLQNTFIAIDRGRDAVEKIVAKYVPAR